MEPGRPNAGEHGLRQGEAVVSRRFLSLLPHRVLLRLQGGVCAGCGRQIRRMWASVDHVIPLALKGFDGFGNWVVMHVDCNRLKADRLPTGCELIWLLAVNARLGVHPQGWTA